MKISLRWLQDFVTLTETDPSVLASRITEAVGEVDEMIEQGALLKNCCVGKILTVGKHPNADKLSLCDVQTDRGVKRVVCGGTNLRSGMRVAFAHVGATVRWHGTEMMTLAKTKIRGEESEGMICAAEELDLIDHFPRATEHSIIDLGDGDDGVSKDLREYLNLTDTVFHIDNHAITHRADLFSHLGFARELVALGLAKWKSQSANPPINRSTFPQTPLPFRFLNDISDLIPRYCSCLITIESPGETPQWMKDRLEAIGWRSVSLPVDITNYVTMELGMPLHSFDADDIKGDTHARTAKAGETIVTLDGEKRTLPAGAIVLSDDEGIFDLLGIMGGLRSSTKESTKRIYLHSAAVDPVSIRRAIIATGHRTDAGTIYEKGIPRVIVERGFLRALELMLELVPGAKIASTMETWGTDGEAKPISFSPDRVNSLLGTDLSEKKMIEILESLEFSVESGKKKSNKRINESTSKRLSAISPLHRLGDIKGEHDLIEEIGRIVGYNGIDARMPAASIDPPARDDRLHKLRDALKEERYTEIFPVSLIGPTLLSRAGFDPSKAVRMQNALGEELSLLQTSTLPSLLDHARRNLLHDRELRTFHWSKVFERGKPEHLELSLLVADLRSAHERSSEKSLLEDPFLLLKQHLTHACLALGWALTVDRSGNPAQLAHPGRSADVSVVGKRIGTLFELHPGIRARFELPHRAACAILDLSALLTLPAQTTVAGKIPAFPAISYDETLILDHTKKIGPMLAKARAGHALLESINVADLYTGKQSQADQYSLTIQCTYRALDRTLTEEEARKVHGEVLNALGEKND